MILWIFIELVLFQPRYFNASTIQHLALLPLKGLSPTLACRITLGQSQQLSKSHRKTCFNKKRTVLWFITASLEIKNLSFPIEQT